MSEHAPSPVVVPPGERADLQKTAQETGERFGRQDALIGQHGEHLMQINGAIRDLATSMAAQATSTAVLAVAIKNIEGALAMGSEAGHRRQGISMQWWLAIFAAAIAVLGMVFALVLALVVLAANGKLG